MILQRTQQTPKKQERDDRATPGLRHDFDRHVESHRMLNRGSETPRGYFRCGRYFAVGHEWYATVREGREIGPFTTRDEAEIALANHVTDCFVESRGHIGQLDAHCQRDATALEVMVQELASCREQTRIRSENCAYVWAKQRLQAMEEHPGLFSHVGRRTHALKHFLMQLDRLANTDNTDDLRFDDSSAIRKYLG